LSATYTGANQRVFKRLGVARWAALEGFAPSLFHRLGPFGFRALTLGKGGDGEADLCDDDVEVCRRPAPGLLLDADFDVAVEGQQEGQ